MNHKTYYKQILYTIILFSSLLGLHYLKTIYLSLEGNWFFLINNIFPLILGLILGSSWIINRTELDKTLHIKWHQIIFLTIPAAILHLMPYLYFSWRVIFITNKNLLNTLLHPGLTTLAGIILGYSITSSIEFKNLNPNQVIANEQK